MAAQKDAPAHAMDRREKPDVATFAGVLHNGLAAPGSVDTVTYGPNTAAQRVTEAQAIAWTASCEPVVVTVQDPGLVGLEDAQMPPLASPTRHSDDEGQTIAAVPGPGCG